MPFRLQGRHFFLTYPQCSLGHQVLYDHLINLRVGNETPEKIAVARELHEDGGTHYHVYLGFSSKRDLRSQRHFDVGNSHPNMQACRSVKAVLKYVLKDGDYLANFDVIKPTVTAVLERAADEKSFIVECLAKFDNKTAGAFQNYLALYRYLKPADKVSEKIGDWSTFLIHDLFLYSRLLSLELHVKDGRRTRSLWLWGPSRTGKTSLARSVGKHVYMLNAWCADLLTDTADYIVLDDISWDSIKWQYKSVLGCQRDVTFTGKYFRPKPFYFNMPCIFLSNTLPVFDLDEKEWLSCNVDFINILDKLY